MIKKMKVDRVKQNNITPPEFRGIKSAQIRPIKDIAGDVFIYSLEPEKDENFCGKLLKKLIKSQNGRMNTENASIFQFMRNAFATIQYADRAYLAVHNQKPFGFMSTLNAPFKEAHLAYLATWKTPELKKVKNGGSMFMNHLLRQNRGMNKITLTPSYNSDTFYYKFGFDYDDEYTLSTMFLDGRNIDKQLTKFSKTFDYKEIENSPSVNLSDVIECE